MSEVGETISRAEEISFVGLLEDSSFLPFIEALGDQSPQGIARAVLSAYVNSKKPILKELLSAPLDIAYPVDETWIDGAKVLSVGVRHAMITAAEIHPEYKKVIYQIVEENPGRWFVEQGVANHFDLLNLVGVTEMTDAEIFLNSIQTIKTNSGLRNALGLLRNIWGTMKSSHSPTSFVDKETIAMYQNLSRMVLKDQRYILNMITFIRELKLPEPLDMEVRYILGNPTCQPDICIDRSKIHAEEIRDHLVTGETHGTVAGADHTSQTKYFLKYPDYDPKSAVRKVLQN